MLYLVEKKEILNANYSEVKPPGIYDTLSLK
jgi:hypothetical protein